MQHPHAEINAVEEPAKEVPNVDDSMYNYHNSRLQTGLLLMNIADAIKEGDGLRLVNCYKFVLLFAYQFNNTKYAYVLLLLFTQILVQFFQKKSPSASFLTDYQF